MPKISEMIQSVFGPWSWTGLRSRFKIEGGSLFTTAPRYENTVINYDQARSLYSNMGDTTLAGYFSKPIVDLQVDFIGHPIASTDDENNDDFLNACLHDHWVESLRQLFRNAIRDSHSYVRVQQDAILGNPLLTVDESDACRLEVLQPERVIVWEVNQLNSQVLERAIIKHDVEFEEAPADFPNGVPPRMKKHVVWEIITPEKYEYYDTTDRKMLTEWNITNTWGFVPIVEVFNEFDSVLNCGQSDLEQVYPLIKAFHDVIHQGLQAHKYHSIPKVKLKLQDVQPFIKNNFPDAIDENGSIKAGTTISWKGKEILFLQAEEDAEFLEARSVLGETKVLADFMVDLICIASSTPRWAFMDVEAGSANQANNAQTLPWAKKIMRKRHAFEEPIQTLLKMVQKINGTSPIKPKLTWEIIRIEDQAAYNQALQMLIMGLEVAAQRQIISDSTYRELLRQFIPNMKAPSQEAKDAKDNFDVAPEPAFGSNGKAQNVPVTAGQQGKNE
jgi:hypothetical protein